MTYKTKAGKIHTNKKNVSTCLAVSAFHPSKFCPVLRDDLLHYQRSICSSKCHVHAQPLAERILQLFHPNLQTPIEANSYTLIVV
jgi:hypothetical protein